jgi:hypothetical protein
MRDKKSQWFLEFSLLAMLLMTLYVSLVTISEIYELQQGPKISKEVK